MFFSIILYCYRFLLFFFFISLLPIFIAISPVPFFIIVFFLSYLRVSPFLLCFSVFFVFFPHLLLSSLHSPLLPSLYLFLSYSSLFFLSFLPYSLFTAFLTNFSIISLPIVSKARWRCSQSLMYPFNHISFLFPPLFLPPYRSLFITHFLSPRFVLCFVYYLRFAICFSLPYLLFCFSSYLGLFSCIHSFLSCFSSISLLF